MNFFIIKLEKKLQKTVDKEVFLWYYFPRKAEVPSSHQSTIRFDSVASFNIVEIFLVKTIEMETIAFPIFVF